MEAPTPPPHSGRPRVRDSALVATLTAIAAAELAFGSSIGMRAIAVFRAAAKGAHARREFIALASTVPVCWPPSSSRVRDIGQWCFRRSGRPRRASANASAPRPRATVMQDLVILATGGVPLGRSRGTASLMPSMMSRGVAIGGPCRDTPAGASILWVIAIGLVRGFAAAMRFRGMIRRAAAWDRPVHRDPSRVDRRGDLVRGLRHGDPDPGPGRAARRRGDHRHGRLIGRDHRGPYAFRHNRRQPPRPGW